MQGNLFQMWPDFSGFTSGHLLRSVHANMLTRCYNPNYHSFHRYGGRGITVASVFMCPRSFMGWAYENGYLPGLELDRIDNDGPYSPDNCRFVTPSVNQRNKVNSVRTAVGQSACDLADGWSVSYGLMRGRRRRGYPVELAATLPPGVYLNDIERLAADGQFQTILGLLVGPYLKETK